MHAQFLSNILNYQSKLLREFVVYLTGKHVSKKTSTNYKSDVKDFFGWLNAYFFNNTAKIEKFTDTDNLLNHIVSAHITGYITSLLEAHTPITTVNRHLSALRLFFKFGVSQGLISADPTSAIPNLKKTRQEDDETIIISEFTLHLRSQGASDSTVRNYVSDIRHLLAWMKQRQ